MKNSQKLYQAALAGLFVVGASCSSTKKQAEIGVDKAEDMATAVMGECHGSNSCKGKGACGGKGHSCAGMNTCKGKGFEKLTKVQCEGKKGKFKAM